MAPFTLLVGRTFTRSASVGGIARSYSYAPAHPDAPTGYNGTTYTYDANGSQVSTGAGQSRTFDPEGRLSSVSDGTTVSTYIYDANGQRLLTSVTAGGTTRRTLYIGGIYEEQLGNGSINYYSFGGKGVGLRRSGWPSGNGPYRLVGDHLGSTTLLVDTATPPSVIQRQYHKPYGDIAWQWTLGGSLTSLGFTGQRLDTDTGLMYYGARFYDPALGYFASADTMGVDKGMSQSRNRYAYVLNNPLTYNDPTGHQRAIPDTSGENEYTEYQAAVHELEKYGIKITDGDASWTSAELWKVIEGIRILQKATGWSIDEFKFAMGIDDYNPLYFKREHVHCAFGPFGCDGSVGGQTSLDGNTVTFYDGSFYGKKVNDWKANGVSLSAITTVHELAHVMDIVNGGKYSDRFGAGVNTVGNPNAGRPSRYHTTIQEDWAESVAAMILGFGDGYGYYYNQPSEIRRVMVSWAFQDVHARYLARNQSPSPYTLPPPPY